MSIKARKYIKELFKTVGTNSILVITSEGKLKRVFCPFKVVCNVHVHQLEKGKYYSVEAVKMTLELVDVFIIKNRAYFVWYITLMP